MGKTIRIRKSGGATIELNNVELITRKVDKQLKKRALRNNRTTIIDDKRVYHTFEIKWRPVTDGTTKESKIDSLITLIKDTGGALIFDWGIETESGYRTFDVACDDVQEIETGGEVSSSLVIIRLIEYEHINT